MPRAGRVIALTLGMLCLSGCGDADSQQLPVESPSADVCVAMAGGNGEVAGLQMDLTSDSACMTAIRAAGNTVQCSSNPSTDKSVQTALLSDAQMRVLFLSVSDQNPVPDGELFCCKFAVAASQDEACCSINISSLILAGQTGGRMYDPGITVQASVAGTACDASAPATPIPPPGF
jgi:hypothetical protein